MQSEQTHKITYCSAFSCFVHCMCIPFDLGASRFASVQIFRRNTVWTELEKCLFSIWKLPIAVQFKDPHTVFVRYIYLVTVHVAEVESSSHWFLCVAFFLRKRKRFWWAKRKNDKTTATATATEKKMNAHEIRLIPMTSRIFNHTYGHTKVY